MNRNESLLIIIDVQEKLAPAMNSPREVINGCARLIDIAKILAIPFIITEQYPKGLGQSMIDIREKAGAETKYHAKTTFSCVRDENILNMITTSGKKQIILAGLETHICILQTALELKDKGYDVFVVSDACATRDPLQNVLGIQRLLHNKINVVSSEMVIFEWLEKSGSEEFKTISKNYL